METVLYASSWFPSYVPHAMRLLLLTLPSSVFAPHDRVAPSNEVLEVPHYLPVHWEAELALPLKGCAAAVSGLRAVVVEHGIPVNMPIEVGWCVCVCVCVCVYVCVCVCVCVLQTELA